MDRDTLDGLIEAVALYMRATRLKHEVYADYVPGQSRPSEFDRIVAYERNAKDAHGRISRLFTAAIRAEIPL